MSCNKLGKLLRFGVWHISIIEVNGKWRMKKWITLFVCLLFATAALMAGGCSKKEDPTKPVAEAAKPPEPEKKAEEAKPAAAKPATQIIETITKITDAFNVNNLDRVMTFFSDDAVYEPGDGKIHRGKAEIRVALEPQFNGAFGAMRFDERDMVIDVENRKAAFRWVCRVDISQMKPRGLFMALQKILAGLVIGDRFGFQGVDIYQFDADGKIKGKFSYAWYGSRPHLQRELGLPLG
jgi:ketosteroid isomerase-like protein